MKMPRIRLLTLMIGLCLLIGGILSVFIFAEAHSVEAASSKRLLYRLRSSPTSQTLRLSPTCPMTTANCVPCRAGEPSCRVRAGQNYGFKGWACQNNNPGNIRFSEDRNRLIVRGGGVPACGEQSGYMVFSSYQNGRDSLKSYIRAIDKGYHSSYPACGNCSLKYFFSRYAPAGDQNDPTSYANNVAGWMGVNADTTTIQWVVDNRLDDFVDAIQRQEGWFVR